MLALFPRAPALSPELSRLVAAAVNPRHGLITELYEEYPQGRNNGICMVHAMLASPAYFRANAPSGARVPDNGIGASFDREGAYWAAIGEACERYSASLYWPDTMRHASGALLGDSAIDLKPLIRVGRPEICAYDHHVGRQWVRGRDLLAGRPVYVPAAMTYLGYETETPTEIICQNDSTGLACGTDLNDACLRGLCELIERDAFAANWLLQRRAPRLTFSADDLARLSPPVREALNSSSRRLTAFYLAQSFGVHVVMTVIEADGIGVIAASASASLVRAVEKAVAEALHGWAGACKARPQGVVRALEDIRSPSDHIRFYLSPERFALIADLFRGDDRMAFADAFATERSEHSAAGIAAELATVGLRATVIDLTSADIADLGFKVARVVVPGFQPLVFGQWCMAAPDTRRIDAWRTYWRLPTGPLNPHPHPFP